MSFRKRLFTNLFAAGFAAAASAQGVLGPPPEEEQRGGGVEEIVVSAMRVSPGGAQDVNHFRGEVAASRIPHPNTLTAEGLFSSHDILLPAATACAQLFCLTGEATRADLLAVPHAQYLAGIGFATNLSQAEWKREPVNLIAVVDKSGSMDGAPLELVRASLRAALAQLRAGDALTIVLYGDRAHVHLASTPITARTRGAVRASIDAIRSEGSTFMEQGLQLGYELAHASAPVFRGRTRLMLFTDERPNVGATDAASFIGMAEQASRAGIGLTTIGVGVQFGGELATRISSVRGGNLFFLRDANDVAAVFSEQFDTLVSELAHDLRLTLSPQPGFKIAGVYGIPGELLGWQNGRDVTVSIPTVFLDTKGGAIFFTLAPDAEHSFLPEPREAGAALARVTVSYQALDAARSLGSDSLAIAAPAAAPSAGLALGRLLVDEFTALHRASSAHYLENDQEAAYQLASALSKRLAGSPLAGLDPERELVAKISAQLAFLSGHGIEGGEAPRHVQLWGRWRVSGVRGETSLRRGESVEFTPAGQLRVYSRGERALLEDEGYESTDDQVFFAGSELMFDYAVTGRRLSLRHRDTGVRLRLERES